MRDVDAVLGGRAEAVGQVEQGLGHAAGHVGEDQVGQGRVGAAQTLGQGAQHVLGERGVGLDEAHELGVLQREQVRGGHGRGGGRARARVEQGQLTDDLAGAQDREEVLAAVGRGVTELDLAGQQDVQAVAAVALVEERLATAQGRLRHHGAQLLLLLRAHALEERDLGDDAFVHEGPPECGRWGLSGPSPAYLATVCDLWHAVEHCSLAVAQVKCPFGRNTGIAQRPGREEHDRRGPQCSGRPRGPGR